MAETIIRLRDAGWIAAIERFVVEAVANVDDLQTLLVAPMEPNGWLKLDRGIREYCAIARKRDGNGGDPQQRAIREAIEAEHRERGLNERKKPGAVFCKAQLLTIAFKSGPKWKSIVKKAVARVQRDMEAAEPQPKVREERSEWEVASQLVVTKLARLDRLPHQELLEAEATVAALGAPSRFQKHAEILLCNCPAHQKLKVDPDDGHELQSPDKTFLQHAEACGSWTAQRSEGWGDRYLAAIQAVHRIRSAQIAAVVPPTCRKLAPWPAGGQTLVKVAHPAQTLTPMLPMQELKWPTMEAVPSTDKRLALMVDPTAAEREAARRERASRVRMALFLEQVALQGLRARSRSQVPLKAAFLAAALRAA